MTTTAAGLADRLRHLLGPDRLLEGDLAGECVVGYHRGDDLLGVVGLGMLRAVTAYRDRLGRGRTGRGQDRPGARSAHEGLHGRQLRKLRLDGDGAQRHLHQVRRLRLDERVLVKRAGQPGDTTRAGRLRPALFVWREPR